MAKKKVTKEISVESTFEVVSSTPENISEITTDFGRADLNELAAKLNEVIRKINCQ